LTYPSEKYDFVSWANEIPNIWKVINTCSSHHQPAMIRAIHCQPLSSKIQLPALLPRRSATPGLGNSVAELQSGPEDFSPMPCSSLGASNFTYFTHFVTRTAPVRIGPALSRPDRWNGQARRKPPNEHMGTYGKNMLQFTTHI